MRLSIACWTATLLGMSGCAQFNTPSAFEEQPFLCDPNNFEFVQAVEDCRRVRDSEDCGGVWSLRGQLQNTPLTITTLPTGVSFSHRRAPVGDPVFSGFDATGLSPYAFVSLTAKAIGGNALDTPDTTPRTFTLVPDANALPNRFTDTLIGLSIRITTKTESIDLLGLRDTGEATITFQSRDEIAGSFMGSFGDADDFVEGCFHLFASEIRVSDL